MPEPLNKREAAKVKRGQEHSREGNRTKAIPAGCYTRRLPAGCVAPSRAQGLDSLFELLQRQGGSGVAQ